MKRLTQNISTSVRLTSRLAAQSRYGKNSKKKMQITTELTRIFLKNNSLLHSSEDSKFGQKSAPFCFNKNKIFFAGCCLLSSRHISFFKVAFNLRVSA